jgi:hypothetical protein
VITCWKCGKELPEGQIECEYGCDKFPTDDQIKEASRRVQEREDALVGIDWDKIESHDDLLLVLKILFGKATIFRDSAQAKTLAKFLREDRK